MSLPAAIYRGKARVDGSALTLDVWIYKPAVSGAKLNRKFDRSDGKDELGRLVSLRAINEMYDAELSMELIDMSDTSKASNADAIAALQAPLAVVEITGCRVAAWNAKWLIDSGDSIDLTNSGDPGKMSWKLIRAADATHNALLTSTPT